MSPFSRLINVMCLNKVFQFQFQHNGAYVFLCGRFGDNSVEVADSSFIVASGYITDDESNHKAKKYLEDAITLYMKHKGPYHNSTIKTQVCLPELYSAIIIYYCYYYYSNLSVLSC